MGLVPFISVAYLTSPFVNYVHLRLPPFARVSREMLLRYSKSLPKDAELDITTMNNVGMPRVSRIKLGDLYSVKERFGIVNLKRDLHGKGITRKWWLRKPLRAFGVHGAMMDRRIKGGGVWANVMASISRR